ncbi:MAG: glycosyltransferase family 39 protein, partial [Planctomycetes bacterium]|nr:glycosyltransferase family 39 protein [Planctomycetota bacterium]
MTVGRQGAVADRRAWREAWTLTAVAAVCLPLLALAQFLSHIRADEYDAWLFAYYGKQLLGGRLLYEQLWDNKPPGIFWLNAAALWLSGGSLAGPIAFCAVAVTAAAGLFLAVARRLYGVTAAGLATVLAVVFLNQQYFHVGCNRPSTFFVVTELAAFGLYIRAATRTGWHWRTLAAAGFCAALGLWFKQSALAVTVAGGVHQAALAITRVNPAGVTMRRLAWFGAGWVLALVAMGLGILLTADAGWAWHAMVGFNREYFGVAGGSGLRPQWFGSREQIEVLALPLLLAVATLVHAAARRWQGPPGGSGPSDTDVPVPGHRPPLLLLLLWAWLLVGVYLALLGPHRRLHYFGIALPPLCMLAAHGLHLLLTAGRGKPATYPPYYAILAIVWFGYLLIPPIDNQVRALNFHAYHRYQDPDSDPNQRQATARAIAAHSQPQDALFIWRYDPEPYWWADRPSAIRYIA